MSDLLFMGGTGDVVAEKRKRGSSSRERKRDKKLTLEKERVYVREICALAFFQPLDHFCATCCQSS